MFNYRFCCLVEQGKPGKEKNTRKAEWVNQKPQIAVFIDLSASAKHWQASGRDDVEAEL